MYKVSVISSKLNIIPSYVTRLENIRLRLNIAIMVFCGASEHVLRLRNVLAIN